jgi:5'(3')-deoxyribonucleotidase
MPKKILYLDMDNVLVDFQSGIDKLAPEVHSAYEGHLDDVPGIFALMDPMPGVMEAFKILVDYFDVFILSTAPWENPSTWTDKVLWVKNYLGEPARKRLILTHRKDLNRGDFLVDDREKHGVKDFVGTHLHFGNEQFPDWGRVLSYLVEGRDLSTEVNDSQPADEPEPI